MNKFIVLVREGKDMAYDTRKKKQMEPENGGQPKIRDINEQGISYTETYMEIKTDSPLAQNSSIRSGK